MSTSRMDRTVRQCGRVYRKSEGEPVGWGRERGAIAAHKGKVSRGDDPRKAGPQQLAGISPCLTLCRHDHTRSDSSSGWLVNL